MARGIEKLSAVQVQRLRKPGLHGDGAGLWLNVGPGAALTGAKPKDGKSWIFRYSIKGRARDMGLGPLHTVSLAQARQRAQAQRQLLLDGVDPLGAKIAARAEAATAISFRACTMKYIVANRAGWRTAKHGKQFEKTLQTYAFPVMGDLPANAIETGHVLKAIEPIWATKSATAGRVRGRIEVVLDYATAHGWRTGENPARWRGHLENILPNRSKVAKTEHHPALGWRYVAAFMAELDRRDSVAALALKFVILTAARANEVIGATWSEIDLQAALWTLPADRTKTRTEHRVPLSAAALDVLRAAASFRQGDAVFPGEAKGGKLGHWMMREHVLLRTGRSDLTVHGFRSTFRDWCGETGQSSDLAEAALGHVVGNKTVAAYARGDLLQRRRRLMDQWATYCTTPTEERGQVVLPMVAAGAAR